MMDSRFRLDVICPLLLIGLLTCYGAVIQGDGYVTEKFTRTSDEEGPLSTQQQTTSQTSPDLSSPSTEVSRTFEAQTSETGSTSLQNTPEHTEPTILTESTSSAAVDHTLTTKKILETSSAPTPNKDEESQANTKEEDTEPSTFSPILEKTESTLNAQTENPTVSEGSASSTEVNKQKNTNEVMIAETKEHNGGKNKLVQSTLEEIQFTQSVSSVKTSEQPDHRDEQVPSSDAYQMPPTTSEKPASGKDVSMVLNTVTSENKQTQSTRSTTRASEVTTTDDTRTTVEKLVKAVSYEGHPKILLKAAGMSNTGTHSITGGNLLIATTMVVFYRFLLKY